MMKKYLIIKLAAIGDVVMAMPMVTQIRTKYPESEITWVCGKSVRFLVEMLPVDHIICVDERKILTGSTLEKIREVIKLWGKIAFKKYDVIALGHADKKYQIFTLLTKAKSKKSFTHQIGKLWPIPSRHHTDEYVRLIDSRMSQQPVPSYQISQALHDDEIEQILPKNKLIVTLAPGGAKNLLADDACRRWPIEHYVELAELLIKRGYTVVISGAPGDSWVEKYFTKLPVVNLVGKTTLQQLLCLFSQSSIVVTHDSGPMHLAGMTQCKLIALFGPTNAYEKIPRRNGVYLHWDFNKYACCPCYDGKAYVDCADNICMKKIKAKDIFEEIEVILTKK